MATMAEIRDKYSKLHSELTKKYYKDKAIPKGDFEIQHAKIWRDCEIELKSSTDYIPPIKTDIEKITEYAKRQGWI